jgi:hypothetical protein
MLKSDWLLLETFQSINETNGYGRLEAINLTCVKDIRPVALLVPRNEDGAGGCRVPSQTNQSEVNKKRETFSDLTIKRVDY